MFWLFRGTKKAKVSETLSPMTELELEVVPQLVLANKDGKIVVSTLDLLPRRRWEKKKWNGITLHLLQLLSVQKWGDVSWKLLQWMRGLRPLLFREDHGIGRLAKCILCLWFYILRFACACMDWPKVRKDRIANCLDSNSFWQLY